MPMLVVLLSGRDMRVEAFKRLDWNSLQIEEKMTLAHINTNA